MLKKNLNNLLLLIFANIILFPFVSYGKILIVSDYDKSISNGLFVGYHGNNKNDLLKLLKKYSDISDKIIYFYDNKKGNPIVRNRKSGKEFSILFSDSLEVIDNELLVNGFADWVLSLSVEGLRFYFTIPYQNLNRMESLNLLEFLFRYSKSYEKKCGVVFKGNPEKLDLPLKKFVNAKIETY